MARDFVELAKSQGYSDEEINSFLSTVESVKPRDIPQDYGNSSYGVEPQSSTVDTSGPTNVFTSTTQDSILPHGSPLTQVFGARNSRYDRISGGVNRGADFAVPSGTPVALPEGDWEVVESFNGATASGPGNSQTMINRGYGNSVLVKNKMTGEMMRFSHLSQAGVKPGQRLQGGQTIGLSGATGHVAGRTGQHLDVEYFDERGRLSDVLRSKYGNSLK